MGVLKRAVSCAEECGQFFFCHPLEGRCEKCSRFTCEYYPCVKWQGCEDHSMTGTVTPSKPVADSVTLSKCSDSWTIPLIVGLLGAVVILVIWLVWLLIGNRAKRMDEGKGKTNNKYIKLPRNLDKEPTMSYSQTFTPEKYLNEENHGTIGERPGVQVWRPDTNLEKLERLPQPATSQCSCASYKIASRRQSCPNLSTALENTSHNFT